MKATNIDPDVEVDNHGSLFMITPRSDAASKWIVANVGKKAQQWGKAFACEPRYVNDLVDGMREYGLRISVLDGVL